MIFPPYIFFLSTIQRHQKSSNEVQVVAFHFWFAKKDEGFCNSANSFINFLFTNILLSLVIVVRFRTSFCEFVKSCHDTIRYLFPISTSQENSKLLEINILVKVLLMLRNRLSWLMKYQVGFKHLFCLRLLRSAYVTFLTTGCKYQNVPQAFIEHYEIINPESCQSQITHFDMRNPVCCYNFNFSGI